LRVDGAAGCVREEDDGVLERERRGGLLRGLRVLLCATTKDWIPAVLLTGVENE
jgi:hypothetical protein